MRAWVRQSARRAAIRKLRGVFIGNLVGHIRSVLLVERYLIRNGVNIVTIAFYKHVNRLGIALARSARQIRVIQETSPGGFRQPQRRACYFRRFRVPGILQGKENKKDSFWHGDIFFYMTSCFSLTVSGFPVKSIFKKSELCALQFERVRILAIPGWTREQGRSPAGGRRPQQPSGHRDGPSPHQKEKEDGAKCQSPPVSCLLRRSGGWRGRAALFRGRVRGRSDSTCFFAGSKQIPSYQISGGENHGLPTACFTLCGRRAGALH